jgi:hypothetical protein
MPPRTSGHHFLLAPFIVQATVNFTAACADTLQPVLAPCQWKVLRQEETAGWVRSWCTGIGCWVRVDRVVPAKERQACRIPLPVAEVLQIRAVMMSLLIGWLGGIQPSSDDFVTDWLVGLHPARQTLWQRVCQHRECQQRHMMGSESGSPQNGLDSKIRGHFLQGRSGGCVWYSHLQCQICTVG